MKVPQKVEAKGIHKHDEFKLGKAPHRPDPKTLMMDRVVGEVAIPPTWDFDKDRAVFKPHVWGNDNYGDCVFAARANQEVRLERIETRRTPGITDNMVIDTYKEKTGCVSPGDANDVGYEIIQAMREWRAGWPLKFGDHLKNYEIAAFGYVNPANIELQKTCCYLFTGIQYGINLPWTAAQQIDKGDPWDVVENGGPDTEPGSWGGHCVFSKRFDSKGLYVITWGQEVLMTPAFIQKYSDESWAVIDALDSWRNVSSSVLNVDKMIQELRDVGVHINS